MTRVLLIGFGPFPGAPVNPSARLVEALARRRRPALTGIDLKTYIFATAYAAVDRDLPKLLAAKPDIVLMFGLAGRRRQLCIETHARNAVSLLFPDANGHRPHYGVVSRDAPRSRRGDAPFAQLLSAARARSVPARLSRDAGRYLCNYSYWRGLQATRHHHPLVQFIHIPPLRQPARPRRRSRHRAPTLAHLVAGAEAMLIVLLAASRR